MKKRVLIIDDDLSLRCALRYKFEHEGFLVSEARNGVEGLEMMQTDPDLVLLDIYMPVMDGEMFLKKIGNNSTVPIIIISVSRSRADMSLLREHNNIVETFLKSEVSLEQIVNKGRACI